MSFIYAEKIKYTGLRPGEKLYEERLMDTGDGLFDDCHPRYWTEEQVLLEHWGKITIDTLCEALGMTRYYIPPNYKKWLAEHELEWPLLPETKWDGATGWSDEIWDYTSTFGYWTPESKEFTFKCIIRALVEPEDGRMSILVGGTDRFTSQNPYATRNYCTLELTPWNGSHQADAETVNAHGQKEAEKRIYTAAHKLSVALKDGRSINKGEEYLDIAKWAYFNGLNYTGLAGVYADNEQLRHYGLATTAFCRAQCYADMAAKEATK